MTLQLINGAYTFFSNISSQQWVTLGSYYLDFSVLIGFLSVLAGRLDKKGYFRGNPILVFVAGTVASPIATWDLTKRYLTLEKLFGIKKNEN